MVMHTACIAKFCFGQRERFLSLAIATRSLLTSIKWFASAFAHKFAWKILLFFFCLALAPTYSWANDVRVSVQVDENAIMPDTPIRATMLIQHDKDQVVQSDSFMMNGKPLKAEFVKDVLIAPDSPLRISFYQFEIKGMPSGLQVISPISVKVGGSTYQTPATTYEVLSPSRMSGGKGGTILNLEAYVNAPPLIFPGEKFHVGYRFYYNENIDLKTQELPLLDAKGFKKIGTQKISDVNKGALSVRGMEQEIEAVEPGKYSFGPSYVVGNVYRKDSSGKDMLFGKDIRADAAMVDIIVSGFPEKDKPASFNGSVGEGIDFSVELLSYKEIQVGDKISLALKFTGKGDLSKIKVPKLCCEPGFPGFFELSDIPPIPTPGDGYVIYYVELRALSPKVDAIPSIEFSYYDPKMGKYEVKSSKPIPITVNPAPKKALPLTPGIPEKTEQQPQKPATNAPPTANVVNWPKTTSVAGAIEIETIYPLSVSDLSNRNFGTWEVLLVIPLGFLGLYVQWDFIQRRKKKLAEVPVKTSFDYFNEAKECQGSFSEFYKLVTIALLMRLYELKEIESKSLSPEQLPVEGMSGKVRAFLLAIEKERFTGKQPSKEEIIKKVNELFEMMS